MSSDQDQLIVVLDAPELGPARPVGVLTHWRSSRAIAFEYARSWLTHGGAFQLDPSLPLVEGALVATELPPILRDTAPDLWGTLLLERRAGRPLGPWELVTSVADEGRMGALRLGRTLGGPFLDDPEPAVPPMTHLRALEAAARAFDDDPRQPIDDEQLALLVAPGSSLGGARPKANFRDTDGRLWIAKFPSRTDRQDSGAWEGVYSRLGAQAGIVVPETRLLRLGGTARTFCTMRFDRDGEARRLYASAMTMTGRHDGEAASYLDIVSAIRTHGAPASINEDLRQLFRRLVFNLVSGNRDDHLRNHGFLRTPGGWRLAPAFDMNPARAQRHHAISLDGQRHEPDIPTALATHRLYDLTVTQALGIVREVVDAVSDWRAEASGTGIAQSEQDVIGQSWVALADARALLV